ncbi:M60 family metallopeptidase [Spiroplasma sp. SV19]|uniref:M60 family metallopeptidase n=1 Tax=Spiroplasma sp. SV19 TaxID=2570468 RepID=UPI0024B64F2B|nr:M60 family metallopeptidase [Spiroplasma sp. SV19]WHQ36965.1 hypothetical protein E7Y35_03585 [Spiroplasma sp. SV19]
MKKLLSILGAAGLTITSTNGVLAYKIYAKPNINRSQLLKENYQFLNSIAIADRENRNLTHSEFKPTGYYLQSKNTYTVIFNRNLTDDELGNIKLSIGQWGQYKNINQNKNNVFSHFVIPTKSNFITFYLNTAGVLYLADNNQTDLQVTSVRAEKPNAVIKMPTFKINQSNQTDFINDVLNTNSPFVEFVSNHFIGTMQTEMIIKKVLPHLKQHFNAILAGWDKTWKYTNEILGLNENNDGINKKYPQYIHIANEDDSDGYANASNDRIMFQNSTSAGENLFLDKISDQWAFWHETGHTYQSSQYNWGDDLGEVTNNISALYVQEHFNIPLRIFNYVKEIKLFFQTPSEKRDFSIIKQEPLWVRLAMFWQLHMAFGANFFPQLNQTYRAMLNTEKSEFNNKQFKIQQFIIHTSEITGYNLIPFFEQWGLRPTTETKNIINQYQRLTKPIWNNIIDESTKERPIVQKIVPIKKVTSTKEFTAKNITINFGDEFKTMSAIKKIFTLPNLTSKEKITVSANYNLALSTLTKNLSHLSVPVEVQVAEKNKIPNIQIYLFNLSKLNNTIRFQGISDDYKGAMGLNAQDKLIRFYGNTDEIHYYFRNEMYYTIKIKNSTGKLIKNMIITGNQNFSEIIKKYNLTDGIKYDENYQISIIPAEGNRVQIFNKNEYQPLNGPKTYIIKNNNFVEIK